MQSMLNDAQKLALRIRSNPVPRPGARIVDLSISARFVATEELSSRNLKRGLHIPLVGQNSSASLVNNHECYDTRMTLKCAMLMVHSHHGGHDEMLLSAEWLNVVLHCDGHRAA